MCDALHRTTSSGVPVTTTLPPACPPSGPRSMTWSAVLTAFLAGDTELAQHDDAGQHLPVPAAVDSMQRVRRFLGEYAIPTHDEHLLPTFGV